jgi:hypothetical protein
LEVPLDPTESWRDYRSLSSIRVEPSKISDARLGFSREGSALVFTGEPSEMARIVGAAITSLAEGPENVNGVGAHVHFDPTSDPDGLYWSRDSSSVVVGFLNDAEK